MDISFAICNFTFIFNNLRIMNTIKKISLVFFLFLVTLTLSPNAFAYSPTNNSPNKEVKGNSGKNNKKGGKGNNGHNGNNGGGNAVGAPIDGGILSILGAAGVSYYLVRKRKRNSSEII